MITERMKLLNCKYLVGNSLKVRDLLERVQPLKNVATFGDFSVYEYKEMKPAWAYKRERFEKVDFKRINSQQYEMAVHGQAGDRVQISLAYNPNWRGWVNGTPISIDSHMALMQIVLPQSGFQQIRLDYKIEKEKPLFLVLIGFALIIFLPFLFFKGRPDSEKRDGVRGVLRKE